MAAPVARKTYTQNILYTLILLFIKAKSGASSCFLPPSITRKRTLSSMKMQSSSDLAILGVGVLGTSLCRQLISSPDFRSRTITGITRTNNRHESIRESVLGKSNNDDEDSRLILTTMDDLPKDQKFKDVVFCAPPSGFEDYPQAVEDAIQNVWEGEGGGGSFVFTSSGGIYGPGNGETVTETSPIIDSNPRQDRIILAESKVRQHSTTAGFILRLAGLYTLERGAHNYWLENEKVRLNGIQGRPDGIVNLLHYDDAAKACLCALVVGGGEHGGTFLISDGNATTRLGICESALKAKRYSGREIPKFMGGSDGPLGKVYDGSKSNEVLKFKPKYESFDKFMSTHG